MYGIIKTYLGDNMNRIYACIDLKSFYASVECVERGLDPIKTNLVVANESRTEKTICLAVTPALKKYGLSGRSRLYEVVQKVKEINYKRKSSIKYKDFIGSSCNEDELLKNKYLSLDYIVATPRMALYIKYSVMVYNVYLKYLSSDDIFVYSIDEIFCDITNYIKYYKLSPKKLISKIIQDVYKTTGITATSGIGTNLYLAKVAMDIVAKHIEPDSNGVRVALLDEMKYKELLWNHKPITDFWRVGRGYSKKLEANNIFTMGDVALASINNENLLYNLFGVNAELLIDHAWGYEPCTIKDIKNYRPVNNSLSSGQVLHCAYDYSKTKIVVSEMAEELSLSMISKNIVAKTFTLTIGYDIENINNTNINYTGEVVLDMYGRSIPKHAHGTINLDHYTSSTKIIVSSINKLFDEIVDKNLLIRRINLSASIKKEEDILDDKIYEQFDIFNDANEIDELRKKEITEEKEEKNLLKTMLSIKNKYGKNSILRALDLKEGATQIDRNNQIGGHSA